jgi:hypothetical protein
VRGGACLNDPVGIVKLDAAHPYAHGAIATNFLDHIGAIVLSRDPPGWVPDSLCEDLHDPIARSLVHCHHLSTPDLPIGSNAEQRLHRAALAVPQSGCGTHRPAGSALDSGFTSVIVPIAILENSTAACFKDVELAYR